jgi:hypothetical protein
MAVLAWAHVVYLVLLAVVVSGCLWTARQTE